MSGRELGYSQMKFNYITDYANSISEQAIRMEWAWQNRKNFTGDVNLEEWLAGQVKELEVQMNSLKKYLEPIEEFK